jgi:hypothetical protein
MLTSVYPSTWHHMPTVQNLQAYSGSVSDNIYAVHSQILEESINFVTVMPLNTDIWNRKQRSFKELVNVDQP